MWIAHSIYVANAAQCISQKIGLDHEKAYTYGLLHDIGRSLTDGQFQHIQKGYEWMKQLGYDDIAKICLTHSFTVQTIYSYVGELDVPDKTLAEYQNLLQQCAYDDYDLLIQLCDAISTDKGYVLLEQRFVRLVLKYGWNEFTLEKWKKTMAIATYFEKQTGCELLKMLSRRR